MKKSLLFLASLFMTVGMFAQWTQPVPKASASFKYSTLAADGAGDSTIYYLYNKDAKAFLNQGSAWGTQATLKSTGLKMMVSKYIADEEGAEWDGKTVLITDYPTTKGKWMLLFIDTETQAYVDHGSQSDYFWEIEDQGSGIYRLRGGAMNTTYNPANYAGCYFGKPTTPSVESYPDAIGPEVDPLEDATAQVDWQFVSEADYADYLALAEVYDQAVTLKAAIDKAQADYPGKVNTSSAEAVYANTSSTLEELTAALNALNDAIKKAEFGEATEDNPKDVTSWLTNPSFDGDATGWTNTFVSGTNATNVGYQSASYENGEVKISGFIEAWANAVFSQAISTRAIGVGELSQTIGGMPQGKYKFTVDCIANNQDGAASPVSGVQLFAKGGSIDVWQALSTGNGAPEHYEMVFVNNGDSLTIGLRTTDACNANWIAADNFTLTYYGPTTEDPEKILMDQLVEKALAEYSLESLNETLANAAVKATYKEAIEAAQSATDDYTAKGEAVSAAQTALESSVSAYAQYKEEVDYISSYLSEHSLTSGDAELLGDYVMEDNEVEPSEDYPYGSAAYIYANALPTDEEIALETARITNQLSTAIATSLNPGDDCTDMIADANFADANGKGWTKSSNTTNLTWTGGLIPSENGSIGCPTAESYHSYFDVYQVVEGAPDGVYSLSLNGFCRLDGSESEVPAEIYMNEFATPLMGITDDQLPADQAQDGYNCYLTNGSTSTALTENPTFIGCKSQSPYDALDVTGDVGYYPNGMQGASVAFSAGRYEAKVYGLVTGGKMTLGVRNYKSTTVWALWGNFKLTYLGKDADALATVLSTYENQLSEYIETNADNMTDPAKNSANAAITAAEDAGDPDAAYDALIALNDQLTVAKANVEAVTAFKAEQETLNSVIENNEGADTSSYDAISSEIDAYTELETEGVNALVEKMKAAEVLIKHSAVDNAVATATAENPVDVTSLVVTNPDFETGNADGWNYEFATITNIGYQSANYSGSASISKFIEGWRSGNLAIGDGSINQTIYLPAGSYTLGVDAIANLQSISDDSWQTAVTGVYLYVAHDGVVSDSIEIRTANGAPQHFSLDFTNTTAGDVEIGIMTESATANWLAADNWTVTCTAPADADAIEDVVNATSASAATAVYSISGSRINKTQKGINIVKMANGTVKKVMIK